MHVELEDKADKITVEGPVEEVEAVRIALQARVDDLLSKLTFVDISVDPKYHKHIIGMSTCSWCPVDHVGDSFLFLTRQGWFKRQSSERQNRCDNQHSG